MQFCESAKKCMNPWVEQTVINLCNEVALKKCLKILVLSDLRVTIHEPYLRYHFVEVCRTSLTYVSLWLRASALEECKHTSHIYVYFHVEKFGRICYFHWYNFLYSPYFM
jgi:hypothetical protein